MRWPNRLTGSIPLSSWLNQLLDSARSTELKSGRGYRIRQTTEGTTIDLIDTAPPSTGSGPSYLKQFKVSYDAGDWWACSEWDGTTLGTTFFAVLKPEKLMCGVNAITSESIRGSTYNYTYTAVTSGGVNQYIKRNVTGAVTETDFIIPDGLAGDLIHAMQCSTAAVSTAPIAIGSISIAGGGSSYAVNDVLTVAGGTNASAMGAAATIKVTTVSSGVITAAKIINMGSYSVAPSLSANSVTGGSGSGATFNLSLADYSYLDINRGGRAWGQ